MNLASALAKHIFVTCVLLICSFTNAQHWIHVNHLSVEVFFFGISLVMSVYSFAELFKSVFSFALTSLSLSHFILQPK
jgi:hypothetical protein